MHTQGLRDRDLDRVGVGDGDDRLTGMARHQRGQRLDHPRLHLEKRLAAGKPEAAGMALYRRPLGLLARAVELEARPLADVALEKTALDAHGELAGRGERRRRLPRALEGRRVDRVDPWQHGQAAGHAFGLTPSLVVEVKAGPSSGLHQQGRELRPRAVVDEDHLFDLAPSFSRFSRKEDEGR